MMIWRTCYTVLKCGAYDEGQQIRVVLTIRLVRMLPLYWTINDASKATSLTEDSLPSWSADNAMSDHKLLKVQNLPCIVPSQGVRGSYF